jgi:hypothetical protein
MDEFSTTSDTLDQADEDILTYTVSDEALEAAAGTGALSYSAVTLPCVFCGCVTDAREGGCSGHIR